MTTKATLALMILLAVTLGCSDTSDLGNGYYLLDQGGSKTSLAKDGEILINYTVTGVGVIKEFTVIESRQYHSSNCDYSLIDNKTAIFSKLKSSSSGEDITDDMAARAVSPINSRSCKHELRGGSRGI
jgi:hypothetical protein